MNHVLPLLALLPLACASSASASPDTPPRPAAPAASDGCHATGPVLFEIDHRVDPGAQLATSAVKVFASGAWIRDETAGDGKPAPQRTGCFARPELKQLDAALHGAPWKVVTARMHCMALSPQFTVYQVDGKPVFTERLCSGQSLDDKSRAKLDAATAQLNAELAKAP
jgi:hypothetical protein